MTPATTQSNRDGIASQPASMMRNAEFEIGLDASGLPVLIRNPSDAHGMNWISTTSPLPWGIPMLREGGRLTPWAVEAVRPASGASNAVYFTRSTISGHLNLTLEQTLHDDRLEQHFTLTHTRRGTLHLSEADFGIRIPLADNYPDAATCFARRCNVHVWPGGHSAWVCALRMGGDAPHLGLVMNHGAIAKYSITDRPWHSHDRGIFVLHPGAMMLKRGESMQFGWTIFWHSGWDEFFAKASKCPCFVRMQTEKYTVSLGGPLTISVAANEPLRDVTLKLNGQPLPLDMKAGGKALTFEHSPTHPGEQTFELTHAGGSTHLRAFVSAPPMDLIESRVRFLVEHQQIRAPGKPIDNAFLTFDNETHELLYIPRQSTNNDQNAARERVGMGVLLALYLPRCRDAALSAKIRDALDRYWKYVTTQLQDGDGNVFNDAGSKDTDRLYNFPWVARLHLSMHAADASPKYLDAYVHTIRQYYALGGKKYYAIGIAILDGLAALKAAGRKSEHDELIELFRAHAEQLIAYGHDMPPFEVNYEQSIVAPACEVLVQVHCATGEQRYRDALNTFLPALLAFNGQQPDHHLHDVAVRHWDGYWFGKRQLYGDTFPHYWSTITAMVLGYLAQAEPNRTDEHRSRALGILSNNFSLFRANGEASCAYLYPLTVNDQPGEFYDPWANDQDWALVHYLLVAP